MPKKKSFSFPYASHGSRSQFELSGKKFGIWGLKILIPFDTVILFLGKYLNRIIRKAGKDVCAKITIAHHL